MRTVRRSTVSSLLRRPEVPEEVEPYAIDGAGRAREELPCRRGTAAHGVSVAPGIVARKHPVEHRDQAIAGRWLSGRTRFQSMQRYRPAPRCAGPPTPSTRSAASPYSSWNAAGFRLPPGQSGKDTNSVACDVTAAGGTASAHR